MRPRSEWTLFWPLYRRLFDNSKPEFPNCLMARIKDNFFEILAHLGPLRGYKVLKKKKYIYVSYSSIIYLWIQISSFRMFMMIRLLAQGLHFVLLKYVLDFIHTEH